MDLGMQEKGCILSAIVFYMKFSKMEAFFRKVKIIFPTV